MAEITAAAVAKLREMTNAGMMDCKNALKESNGHLEAAVDILRKKGAATATTKGAKEAREGIIAQYIAPGGRLGLLVERSQGALAGRRLTSFRQCRSDTRATYARSSGPNHGGVTVSARRNKKDRTILLSVADTGIGMEPGQIDMLFQPFLRLVFRKLLNRIAKHRPWHLLVV